MQRNRNLSSPKKSIAVSDSISSDSYQYSDYYDNQEDEGSQSYKSSDNNPPATSKTTDSNTKTPQPVQPSHINRNIASQSRRPLPKPHQSTPPPSPQVVRLSNDLKLKTIVKSSTNSNNEYSPTESQTADTTTTTKNSPTEGQTTANQNQNSPSNVRVTVTRIYPPTNPTSNEIKADSSGPIIMEGQMSFQITYDSKITYWKRPLCMTNNDRIVYCCKSTMDRIFGKVHIISTNSNECRFESPFYSGMIVRHKSGSRFTLLGKPNEDRKVPQLAGIAFFDMKGKDRQMRSFRLALPTSDKFYDFNNKEKDLSRIALKGVEVDGVEIYSNSKPDVLANHKLFLDMGPYEKKRSLKNFMIKDNNDKVMFIIFKVVHGMCKVKSREPITPIVAFALSVAAITSCK